MKSPRKSALHNWATLSVLIALSACGGGGADQPPPGLATVSTLAYVVTECSTDAVRGPGTIRQRLQIQQGDQAPITVVDTSAVGFTNGSFCADVGVSRSAYLFTEYGVFHRLGVTPDGSQVVFEVTDDDVQTVFPPHALPAEQKGIFAVRADGKDPPRWLGPASRDSQMGISSNTRPFFEFSPNGRTIAYTDRGPSRDNQDAVQIFTLDVVTGDRTQVTRLPPTVPGGTYGPLFTDDQTIAFFTYANPDDLNPDGKLISVKVNTTDGILTVAPPPIAIPGSEVLPTFRITGSEVNVALLVMPGQKPVNRGPFVNEVFVIDGDNVLQLTNFGRYDTFAPTLSADGQHVIFSASANPPSLGTNPTENCQLFSIDRTGGDLRQLTDFHEGPEGLHSTTGCFLSIPPLGCTAFYTSRDTQSDAVVFYSSCDPFGTNLYGAELFAIHSDGTGLHQLTETQGYTVDASGAVNVELPFPFAYPGLAIVYNVGVAPSTAPTGPVATPTPGGTVDPRRVVLSPVFAAPGVPLGIE